jgi:copper transport protein
MTAINSTSMVSRSHAPRHQGLGATDPSGGETTWVTRLDYERNRRGRHVCRLDALLHHGNVTWGVRRAIAVLIAVLATLAIPVAASAHADLGYSSPQAGARLGITPGVVVLEFTQTLNTQLSSGSVVDPSGHTWKGEVDSGEEIRIPMATNIPGVYTVDWVSVSQVDGHRLTGTYTFDVGAGGPLTPTNAANQAPGPQLSDIAIGAVKWIEALALLLLAGQVLVSRLGRREPTLAWVKPGFHASSVALSAGLVVVWAQATVGSGGHSISDYFSYFGSGLSGAALIARLVFEALTLVAVARGWRAVIPYTLGASLMLLAAAGHAAGVQPAWVGIGLDAVHLMAAGLWAGGIAALALVRPPGGWRSPDARRLIGRFTPFALAAFGTTVVAGGVEAILQLGSLQSLFGTDYGRVLLAKMALVACMLPLSLMAWRLRRPHIRIEASIAICVVGAAALLASFPAPPTTAEEQAAQAAAVDPTAGLPAAGELTMAGPAGSVLVGLSLSPGLPGPNRATVYVLPFTGSAAAQALLANISVNDAFTALRSCGATCRQATINVKAGDTVAVDVLNAGGGEASFTIPQLPAPAAVTMLSGSQAAMHELTAYQYSEVLNSGTTVVNADYASVAPDKSTWKVAGSQTIFIGTTQYTQDVPGDPWHTDPDLSANIVPSFAWDLFEPLSNAHVIGQALVKGVPTTVIASFGYKYGSPIWFTFWVDGSGLVRQVQMDAPGHFMTDTYTGYNHPIPIDPPAPG